MKEKNQDKKDMLLKIEPLISVGAFFILLFSFSFFGIVINVFICITCLINLFKKNTKLSRGKHIYEVSLFFEIILIFLFCKKWVTSEMVASVATTIGIESKIFVFTVGAIMAYLSFRCVFTMIGWFNETVNVKNGSLTESDNSIDYSAIIICILSAIAIITICSRSSFIYPFNDWYDPNCYFTVGKSMMNGIVPYRDLFEHKGPLLYFIHGIAWFISKNTFLGVYFIEIISMFVFLYSN